MIDDWMSISDVAMCIAVDVVADVGLFNSVNCMKIVDH